MTYTFEIKETSKSKSLIEHLRTLTYVRQITGPDRKGYTQSEMAAKVRKAEKSKSIPFGKAVKLSERWIEKRKRS